MEDHGVTGCKELIDRLLSLLDDDAPEPGQEELLAHIECCPPCSGYLKSVRATRDAVGRLSDAGCSEADAPLLAECLRQISAKIKGGGGS